MVIFSRQETKTKQRNNQTKIDHKTVYQDWKRKVSLKELANFFKMRCRAWSS